MWTLVLLPVVFSVGVRNITVGQAEGETVIGVFLQSDGRASSHTYVDSGLGALPRLTQWSLCVRFQQLHGGQPATIFSYTNGTAFEELNLAIKWPSGEVLVMCCNYHIHQYIQVPVHLFTWHHLCVAAHLPNDTLHLAFDNKVEYLLTACSEGDFTCSDGSCVSAALRCDQVTDCADSSDELNCDVLQVPHGYSRELSPPTLHKQPFKIILRLEVTSVRVFDLVAFTMQLDVLQSVTWRDARLTFSNLLPGDFNNQAKVSESIWLPIIMIKDSARSPTDVVMRRQGLLINREASPLADDDTRPREGRWQQEQMQPCQKAPV